MDLQQLRLEALRMAHNTHMGGPSCEASAILKTAERYLGFLLVGRDSPLSLQETSNAGQTP